MTTNYSPLSSKWRGNKSRQRKWVHSLSTCSKMNALSPYVRSLRHYFTWTHKKNRRVEIIQFFFYFRTFSYNVSVTLSSAPKCVKNVFTWNVMQNKPQTTLWLDQMLILFQRSLTFTLYLCKSPLILTMLIKTQYKTMRPEIRTRSLLLFLAKI